MEDALEYQATWAAFALQSKVLTDHINILFSRASTHCRARLCRIFASLRLLLSVSRRFRTTTSGNRQGIRQSCNHLPYFTHYTMSSTSLDLQLPVNMTEYRASGLIVGCFIDSRSSASKLWGSLLDNNNEARRDIQRSPPTRTRGNFAHTIPETTLSAVSSGGTLLLTAC